MTKKELLTAYRELTIELEELRRQLKRVGADGRPAGVQALQTDRVTRGTNNPGAAAIQLADGLDVLLERKESEQAALSKEVDTLLAGIRDFRTYLVIYHYYVLARTDEQVARTLSISRVRALQLRQRYFDAA
nr:hypothetical protein [Clostridia bacterium]